MLLGYNTNGLQNHRLEDALRLLADHGYEAVALTLDTGHLDPLRSSTAEIQRIATLLGRLDLHPVIETGARFVLDSQRKHEPTLMTISYGKGRVFHTTLGHNALSMRGVGFIVTLQRGVEWAATGKVTQALPAKLPTADQALSR